MVPAIIAVSLPDKSQFVVFKRIYLAESKELYHKIVVIEKLRTLAAFERKKPPITRLVPKSQHEFKANIGKIPRGQIDRGENIFIKCLFATRNNHKCSKFTVFLRLMIKTINFESFSVFFE